MGVTTAPGRLVRDDGGVRLEFSRHHDAPVEDVWSALTDPRRTALWFGSRSGDPASGSVQVLFVEAEGGESATAVVRACTPPSTLVLDLPSPDGPWPVSVTLRAAGEGTVLLFTHRLTEPYDASSIGPGWHYYLDRLAAVIEGRAVPEEWDDHHPALAPSYAALP